MRKRILVAVGVAAVVAAVAVPVMVAAATPSPTVKPAITAKPVVTTKPAARPDDHGGLDKSRSKDDDATTSTSRREVEPGDDKGWPR